MAVTAREWQPVDNAVAVTIDKHQYEMTAEDVEIATGMYDDDEDQRWW